MSTTLYMLIGLPGSGKTTWRNQILFSPDVFSPDDILEEKFRYQWTPQHASEAWSTAYQKFGKFLICNNDAIGVFDAVFPTPRDRGHIIQIAKGAGCIVHAVYFDTPYEVCKSRNDQRPDHRRVPDKAMVSFYKRMTPPTVEEGFDSVEYVSYKG